MWNDIRLAMRRLMAAKGFTLVAMITLALGIGANTGIFTLVHALMLKSLPVADPERIVRVGDGDNCCVLGGTQGAHFSVYSYALYSHLRSHTPEFEDMCAFQAGADQTGVRRPGNSAPEPFVNQFVSGNYFGVFGLHAFAGRLIEPSDDVRGAPPVAVMSYRAWQHFGAGRDIVGGTWIIEGSPVTVIGVAPPGFFGMSLQPNPPDFWMPLAAEPVTMGRNSLLDRKTNHWLYVFGRLKPGAAWAPIEAKLNVELRQWLMENEAPQSARERQALEQQHLSLAPGGAGIAGMRETFARDLKLLLGITGLVLLIACANLANLQLARGTAAAAQTSLRAALGAPRSRLLREALIESALLAIAGGALGLLVATQTSALLIGLAFHGAAYVPIETSPSLPILGFAFALSLVTGIVFGIAPAWSASRADPAVALRGAGRGVSGRSTPAQKALVVLQAALSLMLLAGAGLMVQTLRNLTNQQFGFTLDGRVVVSVNAGIHGYAPEKLRTIYNEIDRQTRQIAGVRNVALALYSPMSGNNWQMGATMEERPQQQTSPSWDRVSPSFFDTLGAHIVRGRNFDERDTPDATHVAIVNQAFADTYLPNEDPLGKRLGFGGIAHRADYTIVGVVNTIRFRNPRAPGRPMMFLPLLQMSPEEWKNNTQARSNIIQAIILQVTGPTPDLTARVQHILGAIDPNLTVVRVESMSGMLGQLLSSEQVIGVLAQVFGVLALLLASVGLYGITSYSVARRTSEIGVRTALGATRGDVVKLILGGALGQAGVGLALGIPAALAAGRLLADQVYGVETSDPIVLLSASAVLGICAAVAGIIPAVKASGVNPVEALRT
jgi:macrolide transport system ATP-binding/permease protein